MEEVRGGGGLRTQSISMPSIPGDRRAAADAIVHLRRQDSGVGGRKVNDVTIDALHSLGKTRGTFARLYIILNHALLKKRAAMRALRLALLGASLIVSASAGCAILGTCRSPPAHQFSRKSVVRTSAAPRASDTQAGR